VPILGNAPAPKVRPIRKAVVAITGKSAGQPQVSGGRDEHREAEFGPDHLARGADPFEHHDRGGLHGHRLVGEGPAVPLVPPVGGRRTPAQRREHLLLEPGPEGELVVPAVEQIIGVYDRGVQLFGQRQREPGLAGPAGPVDRHQPHRSQPGRQLPDPGGERGEGVSRHGVPRAG
jgi:hypothetical protein